MVTLAITNPKVITQLLKKIYNILLIKLLMYSPCGHKFYYLKLIFDIQNDIFGH